MNVNKFSVSRKFLLIFVKLNYFLFYLLIYFYFRFKSENFSKFFLQTIHIYNFFFISFSAFKNPKKTGDGRCGLDLNSG